MSGWKNRKMEAAWITESLTVWRQAVPESGSSLSRQGRDRETMPLPAPEGWDAVC